MQNAAPIAMATLGSASDPPTKRRPRVLVIDDSEPIARLVTAWLTPACAVTQARSAVIGIKHAIDNPTDLILLDIDMPEVDGFECCRLLKSDPRTHDIPVVFLTGTAKIEDKVRAFECGGHDYIVKPFNPAEFKARVSAALRVKELVDMLARAASIDAVTALHNRKHFETRLAALASQSARTGRVFSCLMVDLAQFRELNDARGHAFGDRVLRLASQALLATMRREDEVCRYGSDVFVVLMPDVGLRGAEAAAARATEAIGNAASRDELDVTLRCSVGAATLNAAADDPAADLLARVGRALQEAKASVALT